MPSVLHQALIEMFRAQPRLAAQLLQGVLEPEALQSLEVSVAEADQGQLAPPEFYADAVFKLGRPPVVTLILEVQLRIDPQKRRVWGAYVAVQHARDGVDVVLVVLTLDPRVAEWARRPIRMGPGCELTPTVIGPEAIPLLRQEQAQACPELAVLSALAHGRGPQGQEAGRRAIEALRTLDLEHRRVYTDLVLEALHPAARAALESLMFENWEPQSEFFRKMAAKAQAEVVAESRQKGLLEGLQEGLQQGLQQGRQQGLQQGQEQGRQQGQLQGERAILRKLLTRRFGPLPSWADQRLELADQAELERWTDQVLDAPSLEALLRQD